MQIRVDPERMRDIAAKQKGLLYEIVEVIVKIEELGKQLLDAWEGVAGGEAVDSLEYIRWNLRGSVENIEESIPKIIGTADAFENIEGGKSGIAIRKFSPGSIQLPPVIPESGITVSGSIKINPNKVRAIASQCVSANNKLDNNVNYLYSSIKELQSCWEGNSFFRYEEEAIEKLRVFRRCQENMDVFIAKIIHAANRYEEMDKSL